MAEGATGNLPNWVEEYFAKEREWWRIVQRIGGE